MLEKQRRKKGEWIAQNELEQTRFRQKTERKRRRGSGS
jgi:hypothetical protein